MRMLTALLRRLDSALSDDDTRLAETIGAWAARHNMYDFGPELAAAAARALVANQACWGTMCEIWTGHQCTSQALMEFADIVAGGSRLSTEVNKISHKFQPSFGGANWREPEGWSCKPL